MPPLAEGLQGHRTIDTPRVLSDVHVYVLDWAGVVAHMSVDAISASSLRREYDTIFKSAFRRIRNRSSLCSMGVCGRQMSADAYHRLWREKHRALS